MYCNGGTVCPCTTLEQVGCFKYLGVFLDETLARNKHIRCIVRSGKLSGNVSFNRISETHTVLLRAVYFGLIHSRSQ